MNFIVIRVATCCSVIGMSSLRTVEYAEHRIPGGGQQRDLHSVETVQAVFGFRFKEHREGITATLLSGEDLISIQLPAQPAYGQDDLSSRPVWPAPWTARFDSQLFHRTQLAGAASAGGKSVPVQHTDQRFMRARHGVACRQRHRAPDNQ